MDASKSGKEMHARVQAQMLHALNDGSPSHLSCSPRGRHQRRRSEGHVRWTERETCFTNLMARCDASTHPGTEDVEDQEDEDFHKHKINRRDTRAHSHHAYITSSQKQTHRQSLYIRDMISSTFVKAEEAYLESSVLVFKSRYPLGCAGEGIWTEPWKDTAHINLSKETSFTLKQPALGHCSGDIFNADRFMDVFSVLKRGMNSSQVYEVCYAWSELCNFPIKGNRDHVGSMFFSRPCGKEIHQEVRDFALLYAVYKGWAEAVRQLLKDGADPNVSFHEGVSALIIGVHQRHLDVCRILCVYGADALQRNFLEITPLSLARELESRALVMFLSDTAARSPLQRCVEARDIEVLHAVLRSDVFISPHGSVNAISLAQKSHILYGLPVDKDIVSDLCAGLTMPWQPGSSHLFPKQFREKAKYLLSLTFLPRDIWELILSFLDRNG